MNTNKRTYLEIAAEYAPYDRFSEFQEGATAYMERRYDNPYDGAAQGVKAQAWDRGLEAASRFTRQHGGY